MNTVQEIQKAIERLTPGELARLRAWYDEFGATLELNALADEALAAHRAGHSREL
jgi:hypothetical protein